jgi:release factor glutamine methyltransferase
VVRDPGRAAADLATSRLAAAGFTAAEDEAAELVAAAPDAATLDAWLTRREAGEPAPWITGTATFCGLQLVIEPGVYVPLPQTEELARRAVSVLPAHGRALDLCTGAGAVAAYLRSQRPGACVLASDLDPRAARCAARNGLAAVVADLAAPFREESSFDLVTAVAPYVPDAALGFLPRDVQRFEPAAALAGGADGLDVVRRVVRAAARLLHQGGWLLLEVGGDQDALLAPELGSTGYGEVAPWWDEEGDLRGIAARLCGAGQAPLP